MILVKCTAESTTPNAYTVLEGKYSPQIRASANGTGEAVRDVLACCEQPPDVSMFRLCTRVSETDANGANLRGEMFVMRSRPASWSRLGIVCLCHKVHTSATSCWGLQQECISAVVHMCKHLQVAGSMAALKAALSTLVCSQLLVALEHEIVLDRDALAYKELILNHFTPQMHHPRKRAIVEATAAFYNADWRGMQPVHVCSGPACCPNLEHSKKKGCFLIRRLASTLRPTMFSKSNWQEWTQTLHFFWHAPWFTRSFGQGVPDGIPTWWRTRELCRRYGRSWSLVGA